MNANQVEDRVNNVVSSAHGAVPRFVGADPATALSHHASITKRTQALQKTAPSGTTRMKKNLTIHGIVRQRVAVPMAPHQSGAEPCIGDRLDRGDIDRAIPDLSHDVSIPGTIVFCASPSSRQTEAAHDEPCNDIVQGGTG